MLLCGGLAGVATWVSIFPLGKQQRLITATALLTSPTDVIKTRLQIYNVNHIATPDSQPLLNQQQQPTRPSTFSIARSAYQSEGAAVFFRGIGICSARAFIVNAVQWGVSTSYLEGISAAQCGANLGLSTVLRMDHEKSQPESSAVERLRVNTLTIDRPATPFVLAVAAMLRCFDTRYLRLTDASIPTIYIPYTIPATSMHKLIWRSMHWDLILNPPVSALQRSMACASVRSDVLKRTIYTTIYNTTNRYRIDHTLHRSISLTSTSLSKSQRRTYKPP